MTLITFDKPKINFLYEWKNQDYVYSLLWQVFFAHFKRDFKLCCQLVLVPFRLLLFKISNMQFEKLVATALKYSVRLIIFELIKLINYNTVMNSFSFLFGYIVSHNTIRMNDEKNNQKELPILMQCNYSYTSFYLHL